MCTHIAMAARVDPTVMIGGTLPILGTGHRVGKGKTIILESCEYCNSFLSFYPTLAVILNIEADHLDFFKDLEDVEHAFRAFADLVPPEGTVLANGEDANTMKALEGKEGVLTFGLEKGTFHAENLTWDHGFPSFDVVWNGKPGCACRAPGAGGAQCEKRHRGGGGGAPFRDAQPGPLPRGSGISGGPAAGLSIRERSRVLRSMTTMPIIQESSRLCWRRRPAWAISG